MNSTILMIFLPAVVVTFALAFKVPRHWKEKFFKIPVGISATVIAFLVGHFMIQGQIAMFAALAMDMLLWTAFLIVRKVSLGY